MNLNIAHTTGMASFLGIGCPTEYNIKADTKPDCDMPGPDCMWEGKHWVALHKAKLAAYGKTRADAEWGAAWNSCRGFLGAFGHELYIANNDKEFRDYVLAQGLNNTVSDLSIIFGTGAAVQTVATKTAEIAANAGDIAVSGTQAVASTVKSADTIVKYLPWALAALALLIGVIIYKRKSLNIV